MSKEIYEYLIKLLEERFIRFTPKFREEVRNTSIELDAVRNFYERNKSWFKEKQIVRGRILASKATTIEEMKEAIEYCYQETEKYMERFKTLSL